MVHPGAYRGNKRQKELKRLQKQEEKRQKRQHKKPDDPAGMEPSSGELPPIGPASPEGEGTAETPPSE